MIRIKSHLPVPSTSPYASSIDIIKGIYPIESQGRRLSRFESVKKLICHFYEEFVYKFVRKEQSS